MHALATSTSALLVAAAFVAGFVDSIAGGGALITIPALLVAGFTPIQSLGTNKAQSLFGSGSATIAYAAKGHVELKRQMPAAALSFFWAFVGALTATELPGALLGAVLPFLLIAIAIYFLLKPSLGDGDRAERMRRSLFTLTVVPALGFYDGIFGAGTGSFFMLAFVTLAGYGMLKATAHTKQLNFASNIGGLAAFALTGVVYWRIGLMMGVAQFVGARLGATLAMKKGAGLIRPLLVVVSLALAVRLLIDPANPIRIWLAGWT